MRSRVEGGSSRLVVLGDGSFVDMDVPADFGDNTLLVSPVTDALKRVSEHGLVEGSIERDLVVRVEGIVLDAETVEELEGEELELAALIETVLGMGRVLDTRPATGLLDGRESQT